MTKDTVVLLRFILSLEGRKKRYAAGENWDREQTLFVYRNDPLFDECLMLAKPEGRFFCIGVVKEWDGVPTVRELLDEEHARQDASVRYIEEFELRRQKERYVSWLYDKWLRFIAHTHEGTTA